jgi:uncharacterized glyoxalase superfamily protein PhnB
MSTLYHGGCLCGAVRFELRGPVRDQCFCYCTSCRRAAGALVVPWGTVEPAAFRVIQGTLRDVRSSARVVRGFCASCGTSLTYRHDDKPTEIDVALATFDDLEAFAPACHLWVEDKPSWLRIADDGLPQLAQGRTDTAPLRAVRPGYAAVSARIVVEDPRALVKFIQQVFSSRGEFVAGLPAELRIGNSTVLVSEAGPRATRSAFLYVYVADVEATHARALALGARELEAPLDTPYGDRRSMIEDAWGNTWQIARVLA